MIDSHTHLTSCREPDAELVARAEQAGVRRMLTIGTDGDSCRAALQLAEDFPQVYVGIGRHPNSATGFDDADLADLRALAAHPRCRAIGETGLDFYRDYAPAAVRVPADRLLVETDEPLAAIAAGIGFRHQCNFSTSFKRQYGLSPSAVRRGRT